MQKTKTPLTEPEMVKLVEELMVIIAKSPEEIEEDCRCEYQSIRKGYCIHSYTNKCDECKNNQLLIGKTGSFLEITEEMLKCKPKP